MSRKLSLIRLATGLLAFASVAMPERARTQPTPQAVDSPRPHPVFLRRSRGLATESFTLASDAKIRLGSNTNVDLVDLRVGQIAHVSYTVENGLWLAHEIVVNSPYAGHAEIHPHHAPTNTLHAHGTILAYNGANGILTIKYRR
jgi:hypothetical protein